MGNDLDLELANVARGALSGRSSDTPSQGHAPMLAARAVADGRPSALDRPAVAHLQAIAGNAGVAQLLTDDAPDQVRSVLSRSGEALDPAVVSDMSARLGADLSEVRIHRDAAATESARAVDANAYTVGSDIVFQSDRYDPSSPSGQRMLAHELTHVVQQRAGAVDGTDVGGGLALSHPADRYEREASSAADQLMAGAAPAPAQAPVTASRHIDDEASIQRGVAVESVAEDEEQPDEEEGGAGLVGQREEDPEEEEQTGAA